jgi:TetR/AcrR family transcriptional regulator, mexJK operon transcriptional repressor
MSDFKPKTLRARGTARREAVLRAAADVFLESGYEKASLSEIMARAGGSKAFVYEQFGDKAGLFAAMMADRCAHILQPLNDDVPKPEDPRSALTRFGRRFMEIICDPQALSLQRVAMSEGHRNPVIADAYFASGHDVAFARLAEYLASITHVKMKEHELHRLSVTFFAMVQGESVQRLAVGSSTQVPQSETNAIIDLAVEWLLDKVSLE